MVSEHRASSRTPGVHQQAAFPLRVGVPVEARRAAHPRNELRAVGIADLAHKRVSDLSGGRAARSPSRALVFHPIMLILDEPTAALTSKPPPGLRFVLRERLARGTTLSSRTTSPNYPYIGAFSPPMIVMGEEHRRKEGEPAACSLRPRRC